MKILHVVHGWPPYSFGGTETFAHALTLELAARHRVEVFCRVADDSLAEYELAERTVDGVPVHCVNNRLAKLASFEMLYRNPEITRRFRWVLRRARPDVVHIHHLFLLSTDILKAVHDAGIPIVMTLHDYWMVCQRGQLQQEDGTNCTDPVNASCDACLPTSVSLTALAVKASRTLDKVIPGFSDPDSRLRALLRRTHELLHKKAVRLPQPGDADRIVKRNDQIRAMLDLVNLFVAPSRYLLEAYVRFGVPEEKIVQCDYGTQLENLAPVRAREEGPVRFGFLGSLVPSKGAHVLVEAYQTIGAERAPLLIAGGFGSDPGMRRYEETLKQVASEGDVVLRGRYERGEVGGLLRGLDVLVVPSLWQENSPVVIHEAFACGVPVVASRIGGIPELVQDGVNGRLFTPGDAGDLARVLESLCDPKAVETLRKGIKPVKGIADNMLEYEQFYARAIDAESRKAKLQTDPLVYAIILNYNTTGDTLKCIETLLGSTCKNLTVLVVDNDSEQTPTEAIRKAYPGVETIELEENRGYAGGNNAGMRHARERGADYLFLINPDATVAPDTIERMVSAGRADGSVGILGATVYDMERRDLLQSVGSWFDPRTGRAVQIGYGEVDRGQFDGIREVDAVIGCSLMAKADMADDIGLLAEEYFCYFEETEWCLRANRGGWRVVHVPEAKVWHKGFGSTGGRRTPQSVYYSVRNQLLTVRRYGAQCNVLARAYRQARVVAFAFAHLVFRSNVPKATGLVQLARGAVDYALGRFGKRTG